MVPLFAMILSIALRLSWLSIAIAMARRMMDLLLKPPAVIFRAAAFCT